MARMRRRAREAEGITGLLFGGGLLAVLHWHPEWIQAAAVAYFGWFQKVATPIVAAMFIHK